MLKKSHYGVSVAQVGCRVQRHAAEGNSTLKAISHSLEKYCQSNLPTCLYFNEKAAITRPVSQNVGFSPWPMFIGDFICYSIPCVGILKTV